MLTQGKFTITQNSKIARDVFLMRLAGEHSIATPGQFVQIALDGFYLRRPISVCDFGDGWFTIIYKVVGEGTKAMSTIEENTSLDILTGLGNGFDAEASQKPLLIGGGAGVPPLYALAKAFVRDTKPVRVLLGFNEQSDVFFADEFRQLGCEIHVSTVEQSKYHRGFVTDLLDKVSAYDHYYACGPEPMLKAVYAACPVSGQLSFESRMACGFGACMGCSCATRYGSKRICKDGPVLTKEEIVWQTPR